MNPHTEGVFHLSSLLSSLFPLLSSLSSLSATMTMITRPVGSLCTHGSDLPECRSAFAWAHALSGEHVRIMQETNMFASCEKQLSWFHYASLAPLGMKWICLVLEMGDVLVCGGMCCVVGCVSVGVGALAVVRR